jgi:hypothetical protein
MGFELGPKLLRRAPRGWLQGRAFSVKHSVSSHHYGHEGGPEIETSLALTVLWRVEVPDRAPYELEEERSGPMWLDRGGLVGSGNRWYKVRVRPSYGLMRDLGVPVLVNPSAASEIWIDWDAAYKEHVPAWEREARVRREVERRKGGIDGALARIGNPLVGKLRPEDEEHVQKAIEGNSARARQIQAMSAGDPALAAESAELMRRMDDLARIVRDGRKTTGTVVARDDTDRTFGNVPLIVLTFDVDGRRVVFEHIFGPRHAKHYTVGKTVEVWVDLDNLDAIRPGR